MDHISFTYDVAGRKTGITYPNGSTASYVYNSTTGDLMGIDHIHNSTSFESLAYTYDAGGLVNSLDRAGRPTATSRQRVWQSPHMTKMGT
jgi:hypothetical protein